MHVGFSSLPAGRFPAAGNILATTHESLNDAAYSLRWFVPATETPRFRRYNITVWNPILCQRKIASVFTSFIFAAIVTAWRTKIWTDGGAIPIRSCIRRYSTQKGSWNTAPGCCKTHPTSSSIITVIREGKTYFYLAVHGLVPGAQRIELSLTSRYSIW